ADLWIAQIERVQRFDAGGGHYDAGKPFIVGGHDIPRRLGGGRGANNILVGSHVIVPEGSLLDVVSRELPVLLRVLKSLKKTLLLLFLGDVEEKLTNDDAITGQIALEIADVLETFFPDVLGDEFGRKRL